jgi:FtsH-binding integral membrane protein
MQKFYKVFLVLFIVFIAVNLYAFDYQSGFFDEDNTKFIFSISAAVLGLILVFVLNTWSKLAKVKQ